MNWLDNNRWSVWDHSLRESWRRQTFAAFVQSKRRDSGMFRNNHITYNETGFKSTLFSSSDGHVRAVMSGAAVSPALYNHLKKKPNEPCPFCHRGTSNWECEYFQNLRPPKPESLLQKRLGWATPGEPPQQTASIVKFLGHVSLSFSTPLGVHLRRTCPRALCRVTKSVVA